MNIENNIENTAANDNTAAADNSGASETVPVQETVPEQNVGIAAGGGKSEEPAAPEATLEETEDYTLKGGIAAGAASKKEGEEKEDSEADTADNGSEQLNYDGLESEIEVPENYTWDQELVGDFKDLATESGLSRENAKKYGELGVKVSQKVVQNIQKAHFQQSQRWSEETLKLPEFSGTQGASNLGVLERTFAGVFSDETRDILSQAGLDNHPGFCKDLLNLGMKSREDTVVRGGSPSAKGAKSAARNYMDGVGFTPV